MSANFALRSLGKPYFAMVQQNLAYMDAGSLHGGINQVTLDFKMHALPPVRLGDNDFNPLVSIHESGPSAQALLELGVTPSGAMVARCATGASVTTFVGRVLPGVGWQRATLVYANVSGQLSLALGDADPVTDSAAADELVPRAGRVARIMLFNGMAGETVCDVSIKACTLAAFSGTVWVAEYPMDERSGGQLAVSKDESSFPNADLTLSAAYYDPLFLPPLWGPIPTGDAGDAYRWLVETTYARMPLPRTVYSRVP